MALSDIEQERLANLRNIDDETLRLATVVAFCDANHGVTDGVGGSEWRNGLRYRTPQDYAAALDMAQSEALALSRAEMEALWVRENYSSNSTLEETDA